MNEIIERLYIHREFHTALYEPICTRYHLTVSELMVLLFLHQHPAQNSATDIVEHFRIAKSCVSASVRDLEERGFVTGHFEGDNRRTIHLHLCPAADPIIRDTLSLRKDYITALSDGFSKEERAQFQEFIRRLTDNIDRLAKPRHGQSV